MNTQAPFPKVSFLDVPIHAATMEQTLAWMENCIQDRRAPRFLCTMNAALLVWAQKEPFLKQIYQNADLTTCDSMVVYYALKLLGKSVPQALEAWKIMFALIAKNYRKGYKFYFLGAKPEVVEEAIAKLKQQYPGIQIAGYHHGYFKPEEEKKIAKEIAQTKPDCLFVGMSSPAKEKFLTQYLQTMQIPISLGVGGGIDILAGKFKAAPAWLHKLGLAWFYRLLLEPRRMWKRYLTTNSLFIWLFLKTYLKRSPS